jgi:iron complex outermembrane receptor protein
MKPLIRRPLYLILLCAAAAAQTPQQPQPIAPVNTTVVVLGTVTPVATDESARTVTVFDPQAHPLASEDPEDYLRTDASVDIQQRGAAGVLNDISIRGASFEQTLVLLNGLRIDDAETSHFNLDVPVPLEALGSIDVLHGEGSTQYGSDAIGGVADFETWHPDADTLRLRLGYGSFGEDQEGILASFAGKKWSELVSADRDRSEGFTFDRDFRSEDAMTETRFASSLGKSDLLFAGDDREFGANQFYGDYNSWERIKGWFAAFTQQFNDNTQADIAYRRHTDIFVLLRNDPAAYKNQHIDDSYEGDLRDSRQLFRHGTLLTGFEETTDEIHSNSLGIHGRNRAAGYAEYEYRVPDRFSVSAGLREEFFGGPESTGFTAVSSPMAIATFWLPHALKLHAAIGHGFRQPTYVEPQPKARIRLELRGRPRLVPQPAHQRDPHRLHLAPDRHHRLHPPLRRVPLAGDQPLCSPLQRRRSRVRLAPQPQPEPQTQLDAPARRASRPQRPRIRVRLQLPGQQRPPRMGLEYAPQHLPAIPPRRPSTLPADALRRPRHLSRPRNRPLAPLLAHEQPDEHRLRRDHQRPDARPRLPWRSRVRLLTQAMSAAQSTDPPPAPAVPSPEPRSRDTPHS